MGGERCIHKLFKITKENVVVLPFAFDRSGEGDMIVIQPSNEFSKRLEPLKERILKRAINYDA